MSTGAASFDVRPNVTARRLWTDLSISFDATQFSLLQSFEEPLRMLVADAVHQLRPERTMNAAIVMPAIERSSSHGTIMYAYRWYRMRDPNVGEIGGHMHLPMLLAGKQHANDFRQSIDGRLPFYFKNPITLAAAFLHHELQREPETEKLLAPLHKTGFLEEQLQRYWSHLDDDKNQAGDGGCCRIADPSQRYGGLHHETFNSHSARGQTAATFVKPLVVRGALVGLFCVDIARHEGEADADREQLDAFMKGLSALGVGLEATLGACSKAYYTHLDKSNLEHDATDNSVGPSILSPAFLESALSEIEEQRLTLLDDVQVAYFLFDNNNLKQINTTGNYECGTEIIRATGRWITQGLATWGQRHQSSDRNGDLRLRLADSPQWWVIRWGGDEFIVVVLGGKRFPWEWDDLMKDISKVIEDERVALAARLVGLPSLQHKSPQDLAELEQMVRRVSASAGGFYVFQSADRREGPASGQKSNLPNVIREGRIIAENRMKLVKSLSKMDSAQVELLLPNFRFSLKDSEAGPRLNPLNGGLRWFFGPI